MCHKSVWIEPDSASLQVAKFQSFKVSRSQGQNPSRWQCSLALKLWKLGTMKLFHYFQNTNLDRVNVTSSPELILAERSLEFEQARRSPRVVPAFCTRIWANDARSARKELTKWIESFETRSGEMQVLHPRWAFATACAGFSAPRCSNTRCSFSRALSTLTPYFARRASGFPCSMN